jgi:hypothetical protein
MERFATNFLAHGGSSEFVDLASDHSSSSTSVRRHLMSKSVCFDRSSRLTAATLLKSPRCRIFNPTLLKRLARFVRGCAPRKQKISQKRLPGVTCLRASRWSCSVFHLFRRASQTDNPSWGGWSRQSARDCTPDWGSHFREPGVKIPAGELCDTLDFLDYLS